MFKKTILIIIVSVVAQACSSGGVNSTEAAPSVGESNPVSEMDTNAQNEAEPAQNNVTESNPVTAIGSNPETVQATTQTTVEELDPATEVSLPPNDYDERVVFGQAINTFNETNYRTSGTIEVELSGMSHIPSEGTNLSISLQGDASFSSKSQPEFCHISGGNLMCHIQEGDVADSLAIHFFTEGFVDIMLIASLDAHDADIDTNNNNAYQSHSTRRTEKFYGNNVESNGLVIIDEPGYVDLTFYKYAGQYNADLDIELALSPGVSITGLVNSRNSDFDPSIQAEQCESEEPIVCTYKNMQSAEYRFEDGHYNDIGRVEFYVDADSIGEHTISWVAKAGNASGSGAEGVVRSGKIFIYKANSMDAIQTLVTNAADGQTVVAPAGYYAGTLDGQNKTLHISANFASDRTILLPDTDGNATIKNLGDRSVIQNISFRTGAHGINAETTKDLSILDSEFSAFPGHYTQKGAIVVTSTQSGGLRFDNNTIKNYGADFTDHNSVCHSFFNIGRSQRLYATNNTVFNTDCNALIWIDGNSADIPSTDNTVYIKNNTFVNNLDIIYQTQYGANHVMRIENNIFLDNFVALGNSSNSIQRDGPSIITSNNIVYSPNVERSQYDPQSSNGGKLLNRKLLNRLEGMAEIADFEGDPMFMEVDKEDFRLSPLSPAIDTGSDIVGFQFSDGAVEAFPYVNSRMAYDGLLDGGTQTDLGAVEFKP